MDSKLIHKIRKARTQLILGKDGEQAWFGTLAMNLRLKKKDNIIAATNGYYFYYGDELNNYDNDEMIFIVCHEVLHCAFQHVQRIKKREPMLWNAACDFAINLILKNSEIGKFPKGGLLYDEKFKDMSADQIYEMLKKNIAKKNNSSSNNKNNKNNKNTKQSKNQKGNSNNNQKNNQNKNDNDNENKFDKSRGPIDAKEFVENYSEAQKQAWNIGGMIDNLSQEELDELNEQWKNQTRTASIGKKFKGDFGGILDREFAIKEPKMNWQDILKRFVDTVYRDDYSWAYPNRRYIASNIYLPSLRNYGIGKIALVLDSSGSTCEDFPQFLGELNGLLNIYNADIVTIFCDAQVQGTREFGKCDFPLTPESFSGMKWGGGGTDFRPAFEHISDMYNDIRCVIFLTDGYGDYPEQFEIPTIWVLTQDIEKHEKYYPPFGEVTTMQEKIKNEV